VDEPPLTIASWTGPRGEVVLRRRVVDEETVDELIVNGAFAMDSTETASERALAALAWPGSRVLVGGLGLGFTAEAVLAERAGSVDVVEIEEALVGWAYEGVTPRLGRLARDPRVRLWVADVVTVLTAEAGTGGETSEATGSGRRDDEPPPPSRAGVEPAGPTGPWDAILLDVDNGPDFLIHAENAALYGTDVLRSAVRRLTPGGVLAIWCQGAHAELRARLEALSPSTREEHHIVRRGRHRIAYVIHTVRAAS
jgi:spermidine synthase